MAGSDRYDRMTRDELDQEAAGRDPVVDLSAANTNADRAQALRDADAARDADAEVAQANAQAAQEARQPVQPNDAEPTRTSEDQVTQGRQEAAASEFPITDAAAAPAPYAGESQANAQAAADGTTTGVQDPDPAQAPPVGGEMDAKEYPPGPQDR